MKSVVAFGSSYPLVHFSLESHCSAKEFPRELEISEQFASDLSQK